MKSESKNLKENSLCQFQIYTVMGIKYFLGHKNHIRLTLLYRND